ncbi:MAG: virulence factor SrfC family protein [Burkholderiaceae bacterium]
MFPAPDLIADGALPTLGKTRTFFERDLFLDWGVALRQFGVENMTFSGGREINEEDNRELGEILSRVEHARATPVG